MKRHAPLFPLIPLAVLFLSCQQKIDLDAAILEGEDEAVCWMTALADDTPLTCMSIPGAHDAASFTITAFKRWTRTQELDVAGLWNCGVRAFDLRPAWVDGEMGIYHDKYSAHLTFPAVMQALLLALKRHPGEGAIVIIRHEREADGNDPLWREKMGEYLGSIRSDLAVWHPGMTLGELRGKILVLSRDTYAGGPIGGYIEGWTSGSDLASQKGSSILDGNGERSPFWVQDFYAPEGAQDKWEMIRRMLEAAAGADEPYPLVVNHTSGYLGSLPDYRANARNVNERTAEYLRTHSGPAGIVMMDFAGVDKSGSTAVGGKTLVEAVYGRN